MGYATDHVKMLKVSKKTSASSAGPSVENTLNGSYPIARPLYIYSLGEPSGESKKYLDWVLSQVGQAIVSKNGYVPVRAK